MTKLEECARAIYELDPHEVCGEYIDGFQVSPGGALSWKQACVIDAEFGHDSTHIPLTGFARKASRAVLRAMREPGARIVQDCAIASAIASGCGCEYRGARMLCNSEHLPADLRSKECSCYDGAVAAIANLVDAILSEDAP